jgi:hypothetical protein
VQLEISDKLLQELESNIELKKSGDLASMSNQTIELCLKVLTPCYNPNGTKTGLYLEEVGDKLIKLCVQLVVRHLNFVMDTVNQTKSISTDRVLGLLEDLHNLQNKTESQIAPAIT